MRNVYDVGKPCELCGAQIYITIRPLKLKMKNEGMGCLTCCEVFKRLDQVCRDIAAERQRQTRENLSRFGKAPPFPYGPAK